MTDQISNEELLASKNLRHLFLSNMIMEKLSLIEQNIAKSIDQLILSTNVNLNNYEKSLYTLQKLTKISQDYLKLNETKKFGEGIASEYDCHNFIEKTILILESLKNVKKLYKNINLTPISNLEELNKNLVKVFETGSIQFHEEKDSYKDTVQQLNDIVSKVNHFNSCLRPSIENINTICIDVLKEGSDKASIKSENKISEE